jgi:hypothetical protein
MIRILGNYYNEITIMIIMELTGGTLFFIGYWLYNRYRFMVYLCEPYLNTFKVKKKKKVLMSAESFNWKDKEYFIDFNYAIADNKNKPLLYYNYLNAQPMQLLKDMRIKNMDSKTFKIATDGTVMKHLGSRRMEKWYTYIIIALVIGMILIVLYAMYNQSQMTNEFARLTSRMINITRKGVIEIK